MSQKFFGSRYWAGLHWAGSFWAGFGVTPPQPPAVGGSLKGVGYFAALASRKFKKEREEQEALALVQMLEEE